MNLQHSKSALMVCTALTLIASTSIAQAQTAANDGQVTELEQIVVKGKRAQAASAASDTPLATQTSAEDISKKQITSISDLGRTAEVGVNFNRSTGAVNIRGLEGSRVLTTVDGIPLAYLSDEARSVRGGVDTVSFSSLSAVDVVRAGDSSRAGAGAMGGVLALRTLEVEDLLSEGRDWGGIAKVEYDSADRSIGTSVSLGKKIENTSILLQGGYARGHERQNQGTADVYGSNRTKQDPAEYKKYDLLFKLRHELEGGHVVGLTIERFSKASDIDAHSLQGAVPKSGGGTETQFNPSNYISFDSAVRSRVSLNYAFDAVANDGFVDDYNAKLYWSHQGLNSGYDGNRLVAPIGLIGRENENEQTSIGLAGNGSKEFTLGNSSNLLSFGHDFSILKSQQYSSGYDSCVPPFTPMSACSFLHTNQADAPKVDGYKLGLYAEDRIAFEGTGFSLTPGVRVDWIDYTPKMTDEFGRNYNKPKLPKGFSEFAISPKLRAEYEFSEQLSVYAQWAMAFRAPTMSELYSVFGGSGTYLRLGNPSLESETGNAFDLGMRLDHEDYTFKASAFFNRYENFIDTRSLPAGPERTAALAEWGISGGSYPLGVTQQYNIPSAQIWGAEFAATKSFDNGLSFTAGFAYANGKNRDTGAFLRSVAPMKLALGVNYDADQWGVGANWIGVREAKGETVNSSSDTYFKAPGYGIVDLSAWYEPEQFKGLKIQAGIFNVFDKTYYDYSSARSKGTPYERHTEPGRTFKISLTQKF